MARPSSTTTRTPEGGKAKGSGADKALLAALAVPVIILLLPSWVDLAVCGLPTLAAALVDKTRERYQVFAVGSLNFCGALPALIDLWARGQSFENAARVLSEVTLCLLAYGAAGLGWLVFMMTTPLLTAVVSLKEAGRTQALARQQQSLIECWGPEVAESQDEDDPA